MKYYNRRYSFLVLFKIAIFTIMFLVMALLVMPIASLLSSTIDYKVVTTLIESLVKEGDRGGVYGVDQIYDYLQKGFDQNKILLIAEDVLTVEKVKDTAENQVDLNLRYRVDHKIYRDFYLSNIFHQTYRVNLN